MSKPYPVEALLYRLNYLKEVGDVKALANLEYQYLRLRLSVSQLADLKVELRAALKQPLTSLQKRLALNKIDSEILRKYLESIETRL